MGNLRWDAIGWERWKWRGGWGGMRDELECESVRRPGMLHVRVCRAQFKVYDFGERERKGNEEEGARPLNEWESQNKRSFAKHSAGVAVAVGG
jgi:hypothetical protein